MTVLLDVCTPIRFASLLQEWGYQTEVSLTHIPQNAVDEAVLALATQLDAVLLTIDLDFSNVLRFPPKTHQGIIVLRYELKDQKAVDQQLKIVLSDLYRDKLRQKLVIVKPQRYRIRTDEDDLFFEDKL